MGGRNDVIVLPVPFHLRPSRSPSAEPHEWLISHPQIPSAYPGVHRDRGHEMGITGVPVDVGDRSGMGVNGSEQHTRRLRCQIPYEQFLRRGGQDEVGCRRVRGPLAAVMVSLFYPGDQARGKAYSAICQVPPCGMNLGALFKLAMSRMYSPFRLARQTSRLLGDIDRLPTG